MIQFEQRAGPLREGTTASFSRNFTFSASGSTAGSTPTNTNAFITFPRSSSSTSSYTASATSNTSLTRFAFSGSSASTTWSGGATTTTSGSASSSGETIVAETFSVPVFTTAFAPSYTGTYFDLEQFSFAISTIWEESRIVTTTETINAASFTTTNYTGTVNISTTTTQPLSPPYTTTTTIGTASTSEVFTTQLATATRSTTTQSTRPLSLFTTITISGEDSSGIRDTHYFFYAEPGEVLWVVPPAANFSAHAVLTDAGSTATSFSFSSATNQTVALQEVNASASIAVGAQSTVLSSSTASYIRTTTAVEPTTIYANLNRFPPSVTPTSSGGRLFTTTSGTYLVSSFAFLFFGQSYAAYSTVDRSSVEIVTSVAKRRIISRGLPLDSLFTRITSTSTNFKVPAPNISVLGDDPNETRAGNAYRPTEDYATSFLYTEAGNQALNIWAGTDLNTGWLDGLNTTPGGWLTGLTVPLNATDRTTNVLVARNFQRSYVAFPGSFEKYTLLKNSITYTLSTTATGTETGTVSTTESAMLGLSGSTNRTPEVFSAFGNTRLGGQVQSNETHYANIYGPAKLNNTSTTFFDGSLSSTTSFNTAQRATRAEMLATLTPITAAAPAANVIAMPRHIFTLV
jgi:hypothetical protein